jgi:glycosyltransferase involved in cell wall biosynthesis
MKPASHRPRLLVVPSWYPTKANPIVGCFFQEQAALLQQRYDVRVMYGIGRPRGYQMVTKMLRRLPKNDQTRAVRRTMKVLRWFTMGGKACPLEEGGIPTPPSAIGFEYSYRWDDDSSLLDAAMAAYRQAFQQLIADGWKPDLIHAHSAELGGIIAGALAREFHVPWVLTEHSYIASGRSREPRRRLMAEAFQTATKLLAVSYFQMRCIILHDIFPPMTVVGNLIDEDVFQFVEPRRDPKGFRILTVTNPSPFKDCETFFRAIALLVERGHPDIAVTVIGNNSFHDLSAANTEYYQRLAAKYRVEGVCTFIAHATRVEMPKYFAHCDVFVSTSLAETFGVAVREAMAVGRPVVCTASGGVEDGLSVANGVKVNIRDPGAVADALITIKTGQLKFDPAEVRRLVVRDYGRKAFLDRMTAVYEDALANNKNGGNIASYETNR